MRLCAQGELRVPLASVRDKNGGEARLYPLELKETAATGYLRLQLQLNSVSVPAPHSPTSLLVYGDAVLSVLVRREMAGAQQTGILAHFGAPLCASMPMRVNVGDLLLFRSGAPRPRLPATSITDRSCLSLTFTLYPDIGVVARMWALW
jgi:hypothetical protein